MKLSLLTKSMFVALIALLFGACTSPQSLLERGNYDDAVYLSVKKLRGKKKKKEKHIATLEESFERATRSDMAQIARLKREGREENWTRIYDITKRIANRQNRIEPLLPLYNQYGGKAEFKFVRVEDIRKEAKSNAADYLYTSAQDLLRDARRGDKDAAREAYDKLEGIGEYYGDYKDQRNLMKEALDLGISHVLFRMENAAPVILPRDFERALLQVDVDDLNTRWKQYYTSRAGRSEFDFEVIMRVTRVDVSPGTVREREFEETKEIEDGTRYVLDADGNVAKDSLGNDIKEKRYRIIRAVVLESFQDKGAQVEGRLEFYNTRTRNLIKSERLTADVIFEHYASTFQGDRRALTKESRRNIGNQPVPFPSDEKLVFDATEELKPLIKRHISNTRLVED
jgi:hypothetical protein